jgi:hypothetical protein
MLFGQMSSSDPAADSRSPRGRIVLIAALLIAVAVVGAALYFADVIRPSARAELRAREQLLQLGAALKQYVTAHDGALPDEVPASAAPVAAQAMYRAVTPAGERLRYESFGERVVAWTEPDASGRRLVLLNSLDETEFVAAAQLDLNDQRRLDAGGGALNRVRKISVADDGEDAAGDDAPPATAESTTAPTTGPATHEAR